ncbi:MAG: lysophospholipase [Cyanobacteria bacterium P01_A01_bin.84]
MKQQNKANLQIEKIQHYESNFNSFDGLKLYIQSWLVENYNAVIVIVHGYGEHSDRYTHVGKYLANEGFCVYTFDLRGHGQSEGERCFVQSFDDYLRDLDIFIKGIKDKTDRSIYLLGHSMGGAISILFSLEYQSILNGLILSAPILQFGNNIHPLLLPITYLLGYLTPKLQTLRLDSNAISRDLEVVKSYNDDALVYHGGTKARTATEIIRATRQIREKMAELNLPLLIMHGTKDILANPEGSRRLFARSNSNDKLLKLYDGLYHEVFNEPEKVQVLADLTKWLKLAVSDIETL